MHFRLVYCTGRINTLKTQTHSYSMIHHVHTVFKKIRKSTEGIGVGWHGNKRHTAYKGIRLISNLSETM